MIETVEGFDWDDGNRAKCIRHGVMLEDIEAMFVAGPLVAPDIRHSGAEARHIAIGPTRSGRMIFVAFTFRGEEGGRRIRPISARFMHRKEVDRYAAHRP